MCINGPTQFKFTLFKYKYKLMGCETANGDVWEQGGDSVLRGVRKVRKKEIPLKTEGLTTCVCTHSGEQTQERANV